MAIPRQQDGATTAPPPVTFEARWQEPAAFACFQKWLARYGFAAYSETTVKTLHEITGCTLADARSLLLGKHISVRRAKAVATQLAKEWGENDPVILLYDPPKVDRPKVAMTPEEQFRDNFKRYLFKVGQTEKRPRRWLAIATLPKGATKAEIQNRHTTFGRWLKGPNALSESLEPFIAVCHVANVKPRQWFTESLPFDHFDAANFDTKLQKVLESPLRGRLEECVDALYSELTA